MMKYLITLFLLPLTLIGGEPHLILHFDVNRTLIASDQGNHKSIDHVLNELLAKHVTACWEKAITEPITYEEYVINYVLDPKADYEYDVESKRALRGYLENFINYLLACNHPLYPGVWRTYQTALHLIESSPLHIFPSFYRLLDWLQKREISYTIVLRSYGTELFSLAKEIDQYASLTFSQFGQMKRGTLTLEDGRVCQTPFTIYQTLSVPSHSAISDDWNYWAEGEMRGEYGKPFYIDLDDPKKLSLFFDDHLQLDDRPRNIVAPKDARSGMPLSTRHLAEEKQLFRVDTMQAILNPDYFSDLVESALEKKATPR